jgi:hypothetical protein
MSDKLSLSVFTIEADRKPILAFTAKKHLEAEVFCADERVQSKLRSARSGGVHVCDDYSILRVRLARSDERARYYERITSQPSGRDLAAVFLVDIDQPDTAEPSGQIAEGG